MINHLRQWVTCFNVRVMLQQCFNEMVYTKKMRNLLTKNSLVLYFFLSLAFSTLLWLPIILNHTKGDPTSGPLWWVHYLGGFGPALAAIVTSLLIGGKKELRNLFTKLRIEKKILAWILLGAVLPIILLLIANLIIGITTGAWMSLSDVTQTAKLPGIGLLGILCFEIIFFGFGEEIGWRGFAWPRLRKQNSFITAAIIVAIPWAVWHIPTFIYNEGMTQMGVGGMIGWVFSLFTGAIILGWLTDKAKGSILPAVFFHGILDVVFVSKAVYGVYDSYIGALVMVTSLILLIVSFKTGKEI